MTPAPLDASKLHPVQLHCAVQAATGLLEHSDKVQQVQMCPLADFTCIVIALGTGMQVRHIVEPEGTFFAENILQAACAPVVGVAACNAQACRCRVCYQYGLNA